MTQTNTKPELVSFLIDASKRAHAWFSAIPADAFFTRTGDAWSASDNLDHLIRSVKPVVKALKLPKITLTAMFGTPDKSSRSYDEICKIYIAELEKGGQASGNYLPEQVDPQIDAENKKTDLLQKWVMTYQNLIDALEKWDEESLDQYQLPHPLLGKLTIREMIFFTTYHNLRHSRQEGD